MSKERRYDNTRIEVCRNCQGTGHISVMGTLHVDVPAWGVHETHLDQKATGFCTVCEGSGRVRKITNVMIRIEPYTGR